MPFSDEESHKGADDAANEVSHMVERFKNRLTSDNLRLSERYIKSELKALVRLSMVGGSGHVYDFIAAFERHRSFRECDLPSGSENNAPAVERHGSREHEPMLVNTVELMDMPEGIVSSDVRLYRTQDFFSAHRHLVYFSLANGRCILLGTFADGEVSVFVRSSTASFDQLPNKMVEGTPEIVNGISDHQVDFVGDGLNTADIKSYMLNLSFRLDSKRIRLRVAEHANPAIQITDVLFGPFNFESYPVDSGHGSS